jgi:hypothetical protein
MTAEQILSYVNKKGIILTPDGNRIKYKAPMGIMTSDLVDMIRMCRQGILGILNEDRQIKSTSPYLSAEDGQNSFQANCDPSPAAGFWESKGPGLWCFYSAYFLGKSARPVGCKTARQDCPLLKNGT